MKVTIISTQWGKWYELEWGGCAGSADTFAGALNGLMLALSIEHIEVKGV